MNHLQRIINQGYEDSKEYQFARRNFAWMANRQRLLQKVDYDAPRASCEVWEVIPDSIERSKRGVKSLAKSFFRSLLP